MTPYNEVHILPGTFTDAARFTLEVCERLQQHMDDTDAQTEMLKRAKWVIMELHTNSIKHSSADEVHLQIGYDGHNILIEKKDNGRPLSLTKMNSVKKCHWPLDETFYNDKFDVYGDDVYTLKVEIDSMGTATFKAQEQTSQGRGDNISEHFGLLIMARAADEFTYNFDLDARENIFSCLIRERNY